MAREHRHIKQYEKELLELKQRRLTLKEIEELRINTRTDTSIFLSDITEGKKRLLQV